MAGNDAAVKDASEELEQVPVVEVQRRLSELMNRAAYAGERIILTRNGKPTAAIVGIEDLKRLEHVAAV